VLLLDAAALIALIRGEPASGRVDDLIAEGGCGITLVNLAESVDRLARRHGLAATRTRPAIEALLGGVLAPVAVQVTHSWRAAELRIAHYHRRECAISLADCVLLAAARPADRIATSDRAVIGVARREGIAVEPLPDSHGDLSG
jgi:PIN domain nuclease of toxin-antitoxin system